MGPAIGQSPTYLTMGIPAHVVSIEEEEELHQSSQIDFLAPNNAKFPAWVASPCARAYRMGAVLLLCTLCVDFWVACDACLAT
jgi:hypothetical protein